MLIGFLILALSATATQVEVSRVPCPAGGAPVEVFRLISQNSYGGWDSDGARYSTKGQFRTYEVSTCPNNPLSLYGRDMARGLDDEALQALEPVLAQLEQDYPDPSKVEVWDRYLMAGRVYEALGREPLFVARVYLEGAWTLRDAAVGVTPGLSGPLVARRLLLAGEQELAKELPPETERIVLFNLARTAHRAGYAPERDRHLARLRSFDDLDADEQQALAHLERAIATEPRMLELAMTHLSAHLDRGEGSPELRAEARYLLADLLRRTGRLEVAATAYDAVATDRKAPDSLRALARYLAAEIRGERPWETAGDDPFTAPP